MIKCKNAYTSSNIAVCNLSITGRKIRRQDCNNNYIYEFEKRKISKKKQKECE